MISIKKKLTQKTKKTKINANHSSDFSSLMAELQYKRHQRLTYVILPIKTKGGKQ